MTYTNLRPEHLPAFRDGATFSVMLDENFPCADAGRALLTYNTEYEDWCFSCEYGLHGLAGHVSLDDDGEPYFEGIYLDD